MVVICSCHVYNTTTTTKSNFGVTVCTTCTVQVRVRCCHKTQRHQVWWKKIIKSCCCSRCHGCHFIVVMYMTQQQQQQQQQNRFLCRHCMHRMYCRWWFVVVAMEQPSFASVVVATRLNNNNSNKYDGREQLNCVHYRFLFVCCGISKSSRVTVGVATEPPHCHKTQQQQAWWERTIESFSLSISFCLLFNIIINQL